MDEAIMEKGSLRGKLQRVAFEPGVNETLIKSFHMQQGCGKNLKGEWYLLV